MEPPGQSDCVPEISYHVTRDTSVSYGSSWYIFMDTFPKFPNYVDWPQISEDARRDPVGEASRRNNAGEELFVAGPGEELFVAGSRTAWNAC